MKYITYLILFSVAPGIQAQEKSFVLNPHRRSQISVEVYTGIGFTKYNSGLYVLKTNEAVRISFGGGLGIGLRYGTMIFKNVRLSLGAYYQKGKFNEDVKYSSGGVYKCNFNPSLRYFISLKNNDTYFYMGAGLLISAFTTYDVKLDDPTTGVYMNYAFKYKTAFGPVVEIGVEVPLSSRFVMDFGWKYHYIMYSLDHATFNGQAVSMEKIQSSYYSSFIKPNGQGIDFMMAFRYCF